MGGAWRISDEDEAEALRNARRIAQQTRTAEAWAKVDWHVERCKHLGVPEEEWLA